jgi:hypothetical protein
VVLAILLAVGCNDLSLLVAGITRCIRVVVWTAARVSRSCTWLPSIDHTAVDLTIFLAIRCDDLPPFTTNPAGGLIRTTAAVLWSSAWTL